MVIVHMRLMYTHYTTTTTTHTQAKISTILGKGTHAYSHKVSCTKIGLCYTHRHTSTRKAFVRALIALGRKFSVCLCERATNDDSRSSSERKKTHKPNEAVVQQISQNRKICIYVYFFFFDFLCSFLLALKRCWFSLLIFRSKPSVKESFELSKIDDSSFP